MDRPATRLRIGHAAQARRSLMEGGRAIQKAMRFDVYDSYGVSVPDGRTF